MKPSRYQLEELYARLIRVYGKQNWWPADTPFEIMVGAILTQNTAWTNVEKAIKSLKQANALNTHSIIQLDDSVLAELIRPSGYFNIKATRLKNFTEWFVEQRRFKGLDKLDDVELRKELLTVNGIGPETADDILLYAFKRSVFVIDVYTRRLLKSLNLIQGDEPYDTLRQYFESALAPDVDMFNEYHALIVRHAKQKCTAETDCIHCLVEAPMDK